MVWNSCCLPATKVAIIPLKKLEQKWGNENNSCRLRGGYLVPVVYQTKHWLWVPGLRRAPPWPDPPHTHYWAQVTVWELPTSIFLLPHLDSEKGPRQSFSESVILGDVARRMAALLLWFDLAARKLSETYNFYKRYYFLILTLKPFSSHYGKLSRMPRRTLEFCHLLNVV